MTYRFMIKRLLQAGACCSASLALGSCGGGSSNDSQDTGLAPYYFMPQECASATVSVTLPKSADHEDFSVTVTCQGGSDLYNGAITGGSFKKGESTITVDSGVWKQVQRTSYNQFNGLCFVSQSSNVAVVDMCVAIQTRDNDDHGAPVRLQGQAITGRLEVRDSMSNSTQYYPIVGSNVTIEYVSAGSAPNPESGETGDKQD